ncbi:hypothetical protein [Paraburkholderia sartisoli]|uniref:hypothetical protein n=1 Tax=Paraburkholderia sartisoli TaxID=83784 RepID=UPI0015A2D1F0|nr:hypothetical protein [Paraburkholderia sartisoli]
MQSFVCGPAARRAAFFVHPESYCKKRLRCDFAEGFDVLLDVIHYALLPFRYLVREHRAEVKFIGNALQPLVARPDSDAGLQARGCQQ